MHWTLDDVHDLSPDVYGVLIEELQREIHRDDESE